MAVIVLTDAHVIINGVTLSSNTNEVTVEDSRESVDITAFGATTKQITKGLGDGKITLKMWQDFAAGKTYATLQPLISSSTGVVVEIRPTSSGRSTTNPAALMTGLLMTFNMLDGAVGDASEITAEFVNSGAAGITYATA